MKTALFYCLLAVVPIHASTIFDLGPPNNNALDMVDSRIANAFTLASAATITDVNFWYQAQFESDLTNVAYAFYLDSAGTLGSLVTAGTATPLTSADPNAFLASFTIPDLSLVSGVYWLELHAGSSLTSDNGGLTIWWAATDTSGVYPALTHSGSGLPDTPMTVPGFQQDAFQLMGTAGAAVPEPSTTLFDAGGLGMILALFLKRTS